MRFLEAPLQHKTVAMNDNEKKYPGRPPRLSRVFDQTPLYFVTFNTFQRRKLLADEAVHNAFISYAAKNKDRGFAVGRYVIMPDHIHLFVRVGMHAKLDQFIRLMKQDITKTLSCSGGSQSRFDKDGNVVHRTAATPIAAKVWQPGFFDHVMRSSESYSEKWTYVRMNPVRAGLVANPNDWRYQGELEIIHFP